MPVKFNFNVLSPWTPAENCHEEDWYGQELRWLLCGMHYGTHTLEKVFIISGYDLADLDEPVAVAKMDAPIRPEFTIKVCERLKEIKIGPDLWPAILAQIWSMPSAPSEKELKEIVLAMVYAKHKTQTSDEIQIALSTLAENASNVGATMLEFQEQVQKAFELPEHLVSDKPTLSQIPKAEAILTKKQAQAFGLNVVEAPGLDPSKFKIVNFDMAKAEDHIATAFVKKEGGKWKHQYMGVFKKEDFPPVIPPLKICPACGSVNHPGYVTCTSCECDL